MAGFKDEAVEKIVQESAGLKNARNAWMSHCVGPKDRVEQAAWEASCEIREMSEFAESAVRSALREFGELLAKTRCKMCSKGWRFDTFGTTRALVHRDEEGDMWPCAASDIWAALEEQ